MPTHHEYDVESDDGVRIVFVCPVAGCGRRVVLDRGQPRYVVVDTGDFSSRHVGAVGPISITVGLVP